MLPRCNQGVNSYSSAPVRSCAILDTWTICNTTPYAPVLFKYVSLDCSGTWGPRENICLLKHRLLLKLFIGLFYTPFFEMLFFFINTPSISLQSFICIVSYVAVKRSYSRTAFIHISGYPDRSDLQCAI